MSYPGSGWSSAEGPGRKVWGGGGSSPPDISCAVQLGTIPASAWDSGETHNVNSPSPISYSPAITPAVPSIVIGFFGGQNQSEPMARYPASESMSGFTGWFDSRATWVPQEYSSLAMAGYKAGTGSPGSFTVTWAQSSGTGALSHRADGLAFATAATAPVQVGAQYQAGGTITFGAPPTAGNLLVYAGFCENDAGVILPSGWVTITSGTISQGVNVGSITLAVRCVDIGEGATITLASPSKSHWQAVSEWALT